MVQELKVKISTAAKKATKRGSTEAILVRRIPGEIYSTPVTFGGLTHRSSLERMSYVNFVFAPGAVAHGVNRRTFDHTLQRWLSDADRLVCKIDHVKGADTRYCVEVFFYRTGEKKPMARMLICLKDRVAMIREVHETRWRMAH